MTIISFLYILKNQNCSHICNPSCNTLITFPYGKYNHNSENKLLYQNKDTKVIKYT